jgi:hypothetical protein
MRASSIEIPAMENIVELPGIYTGRPGKPTTVRRGGMQEEKKNPAPFVERSGERISHHEMLGTILLS